MTETLPLLRIRGLCKHFPVYSRGLLNRVIGSVKSVDNVSFDVFTGETLGLVGESGCGKTTTARTILRALKPTSGSILFQDNNRMVDLASMDEKHLKSFRPKMQMIFQDPFSSLNPRMTVGSTIAEALIINKRIPKRQIKDRVAEMLTMVGLEPDDAVRYPHAFSGGQRQRIGIARTLILKPSFVICDEPVSALDVSVQAQIINLLEELQQQFKLTYIFVAHDLNVVRHISNRVAVMYAGRIVELGETEQIFNTPLHPYTRTLMEAMPYPDPDRKITYRHLGEVADPANLPNGCSFHPRCPKCSRICKEQLPSLTCYGNNHYVACHPDQE
jgi:peptide/nickel transport system ATP-binding protein